jgi:hypothetical protein
MLIVASLAIACGSADPAMGRSDDEIDAILSEALLSPEDVADIERVHASIAPAEEEFDLSDASHSATTGLVLDDTSRLVVIHYIGVFTNEDASAVFRELRQSNAILELGGGGTMAEIPAPELGDQAMAFRITQDGFTGARDLELIMIVTQRKGLLSLTGLGGFDLTNSSSNLLAGRALEKLDRALEQLEGREPIAMATSELERGVVTY